MPPKSYALYLKYQWLQFQIKALAQQGIMPFQDYRKFNELCDKRSLEDKAKISEFYLHNLALTYLNVWDPNPKLQDLQMMALASWMSHEEARAKEVNIVFEREETQPLYIREEHNNYMVVISTHNLIATYIVNNGRLHLLDLVLIQLCFKRTWISLTQF